jgi:hypothetical protein
MTELNEKNKIEITLPIKVERTSKSRRKAVAAVLDLPEDRQPDLLYFSGIMVSSGENLNHAFFLPSELIKAEGTIVNKAVDKEHEEKEVIGHIYDRVFVDKEGKVVDFTEIAELETADLNKLELDVVIAGIIYKGRFPEEAEEVKKGDWSLSMEAYFKDYDVKIGDILIPRKEAEALGLTEASIGKDAVVKSEEEELSAGPVTRVLRDILFAGCGIVKNPANPASIFLDTAALKDGDNEVIELKNISEVAEEVEVEVSLEEDVVDEETKDKEDAGDWIAQPQPVEDLTGPGGPKRDTVGQCIHFNRFAADAGEGASDNWCRLYGTACTSQYREQRDPECLYHKAFLEELGSVVEQVLAEQAATKEQQEREELLDALKEALKVAIDKAAMKCGTHHNMPKKKKKKTKKKKKKSSY